MLSEGEGDDAFEFGTEAAGSGRSSIIFANVLQGDFESLFHFFGKKGERE